MIFDDGCHIAAQTKSAPKSSLHLQRILYETLKTKLFDCKREQDTQPQPAVCQTAINLTEFWRADHAGSRFLPDGKLNCDTQDMVNAGRPWFRFQGAAGHRILDHCVPGHSCGTNGALWTDSPVPHVVGVEASIKLNASWNGNCESVIYEGSVIRCSKACGDFVYKYYGGAGCARGFCGMH